MQQTLKNTKCNQEGDRILIIEGLKKNIHIKMWTRFIFSKWRKKSVFQTNLEVSQGEPLFLRYFLLFCKESH